MDEQQALEILKGDFTIEIPNFKKWNPDTRFRRTWFALSTDWNIDPKVMQLSQNGKLFWLLLLTFRATSPSHLVNISLTSLRLRTHFQGTSLRLLILKLLKLQLIDLRCAPLHNRHNIHNNTNVHSASLRSLCSPNTKLKKTGVKKVEQPNAEFEAFYSRYPVKRGKKAGLKKFLKLKENEKLRLNKALANYLAEIEREGTPLQFIKHFSTFMNNWEDYEQVLKPTVSLVVPQRKEGDIVF